MQTNLFDKAKEFLDNNIVKIDNWKDFEKTIKDRKLVKMLFCGEVACEEEIKEKTKATSRCIPFEQESKKGVCVHCGKHAELEVYFSKAY